jgi:dCMP deaminase
VGYNGFPIDVIDTEDRWKRPDKYDFVCHAEQNAILLAARHGTRLGESTLYVNKKLICKSCCKSIIQAGIQKVIVPEEGKLSDRWDKDMEVVQTMFDEAGVELNKVSRG